MNLHSLIVLTTDAQHCLLVFTKRAQLKNIATHPRRKRRQNAQFHDSVIAFDTKLKQMLPASGVTASKLISSPHISTRFKIY